MKKYKTKFEENKAVVTLDGAVIKVYEKFTCEKDKQFRRGVERENMKSLQ
jgi:hypothetical protein